MSSFTTLALAGVFEMNNARSLGDLLYALQGLSLARNLPIPEVLAGLEVFAPLLDCVRQEKALFLLNFNPRPNDDNKPDYVASISGGLRWDGGAPIVNGDDVMESAVARTILEYA